MVVVHSMDCLARNLDDLRKLTSSISTPRSRCRTCGAAENRLFLTARIRPMFLTACKRTRRSFSPIRCMPIPTAKARQFWSQPVAGHRINAAHAHLGGCDVVSPSKVGALPAYWRAFHRHHQLASVRAALARPDAGDSVDPGRSGYTIDVAPQARHAQSQKLTLPSASGARPSATNAVPAQINPAEYQRPENQSRSLQRISRLGLVRRPHGEKW